MADQPFVLDFAWERPGAAAIKASGAVGVIRYLGSDKTGKILTAEEVAEYRAASLAIGVVFENEAARATRGHDVGLQDAIDARAQARGLGIPDTVPIFFACDTNTTYAAVQSYYAGVLEADVNAVIPRRGVYGEAEVVQPLLGNFAVWQTSAWSNGVFVEGSALYQNANHVAPIAGTDWNLLLDPSVLWAADGAPVLVSGSVPPAVSYGAFLQQGASGQGVTDVQKLLNARGFGPIAEDGSFGPKTDAAVRAAQKAYGLTVDGVVGPKTRGALQGGAPATRPVALAVDGQFGPQTITALQRLIGASPDGVYGPDTRRKLQAWLGVAQDGVVGPVTVRALQARIGATQDGVWGAGTTSALQVYLNAH